MSCRAIGAPSRACANTRRRARNVRKGLPHRSCPVRRSWLEWRLLGPTYALLFDWLVWFCNTSGNRVAIVTTPAKRGRIVSASSERYTQ